MVLLVSLGVVFRGRLHRTEAPSAARVAAGETPVVKRPPRVVPDSVRIKVEVVNATDIRGLGQLATAWLRDQGFDVVTTTTAAEKDRRDSSLVLDRSGHPAWAALAAKALGGAGVAARTDSLRFLDLTVLVGRSWRPPQPFYRTLASADFSGMLKWAKDFVATDPHGGGRLAAMAAGTVNPL
ncbi:MAG: LytR C-terminal domain-containing protein, partial [Deltaproteobacteria bacterium]